MCDSVCLFYLLTYFANEGYSVTRECFLCHKRDSDNHFCDFRFHEPPYHTTSWGTTHVVRETCVSRRLIHSAQQHRERHTQHRHGDTHTDRRDHTHNTYTRSWYTHGLHVTRTLDLKASKSWRRAARAAVPNVGASRRYGRSRPQALRARRLSRPQALPGARAMRTSGRGRAGSSTRPSSRPT